MLARPLLADPDWCNKALPAMWRRSGRVSAVRKAALMSLFWEGIRSVQSIREPDSRNVFRKPLYRLRKRKTLLLWEAGRQELHLH